MARPALLSRRPKPLSRLPSIDENQDCCGSHPELCDKSAFVARMQEDEASLLPLWEEAGGAKEVKRLWEVNRRSWDCAFVLLLLRFLYRMGCADLMVEISEEVLGEVKKSVQARLLQGLAGMGMGCRKQLIGLMNKRIGGRESFRYKLVYWRGCAELARGQFQAAHHWFGRLAKAIRFGGKVDGEDVGNAMFGLGEAKRGMGELGSAKELMKKAVGVRTGVLGEDHVDTVQAKQGLARVYEGEKRYQDAEKLLVEVLKVRGGKLGMQHPETVTTMRRLALVYVKRGKMQDAVELMQLTLRSMKAKAWSRDPSMLATVSNLATAYMEIGKYEAAEELMVHVMEGMQVSLGFAHPDTVSVMSNLAILYSQTGRLQKAEALLKEILSLLDTSPWKYENTLRAMNNLIVVYVKQGKYECAYELIRRLLEIKSLQLGWAHPQTLLTMINLGMMQLSMSDSKRGGTALHNAFNICQVHLGPYHQTTLHARKCIMEHDNFLEEIDSIRHW